MAEIEITKSADGTAIAYDRAGHGPPLVAEAAGAGGSAVFAYGHSPGAALALQAAARGGPFAAIAAYEPPYPAGSSRPSRPRPR